MIDRQRLKIQLAKHEEDRPFVYDDATGKEIKPGYTCIGNPTIGIGRNLYGKGLSESERQFLADNDITDVEQIAKQFSWFGGLDTVRQNVIAELIFNMGLESFRTFRNFIIAMSQHQWSYAAAELADSKWQKEVDPVLGDGKGRADTLINMIRTGEWPT